MEAVEYEWVVYQNKFDQPSAYRGQPTPELERAWEDLIACPHLPATNFLFHADLANLVSVELINIPVEKLSLLNKSVTGPWRHLPKSQGGGVAGFIEVFHQLHCLVSTLIYLDSI